MATTGVSRNTQVATIQEILGQLGATGKQAVATISTAASSAAASSFTPETGNYMLRVLYYFFMYALVIFTVLLLIHFTVTPVFKITPGGKGVIGVPGVDRGNKVYWNERTQPPRADKVPKANDTLSGSMFLNEFSFSVDLLVRRVPQTNTNNRIIMWMGNRCTESSGSSCSDLVLAAPSTNQTLDAYLAAATNMSMVMYLTETNDLVVSFYTTGSNSTNTWFPCRPIRNIPLYTPFRVGVIVEKRIFTVYLNNQQAFQRVVPNDLGAVRTQTQAFYTAPVWAQNPRQTAFVQNLIVWDRAIQYSELKDAQPALATVPDFDAPTDPDDTSCS